MNVRTARTIETSKCRHYTVLRAKLEGENEGRGRRKALASPGKPHFKQLFHPRLQDTLHVECIDIGCTPEDIATMIQKTKYACGVCNLRGSGNPANYTAWGVLQGMKSVCQQLDNSPSIEGKTVAIQGIGNVGRRLAELLFWEGAQLILADREEGKVIEYAHRYAAKTVSPDEILSVECDIVSPNAMGAVLNEDSIPRLQCRAVAGGANNQLLETVDANTLAKRGILYAPDFVINAGGLINVIHELTSEGYRASCAREMTKKIYHQLLDIYKIAKHKSISTHQAALSIVDDRLRAGVGRRKEALCFPASDDAPYCKTVRKN